MKPVRRGPPSLMMVSSARASCCIFSRYSISISWSPSSGIIHLLWWFKVELIMAHYQDEAPVVFDQIARRSGTLADQLDDGAIELIITTHLDDARPFLEPEWNIVGRLVFRVLCIIIGHSSPAPPLLSWA